MRRPRGGRDGRSRSAVSERGASPGLSGRTIAARPQARLPWPGWRFPARGRTFSAAGAACRSTASREGPSPVSAGPAGTPRTAEAPEGGRTGGQSGLARGRRPQAPPHCAAEGGHRQRLRGAPMRQAPQPRLRHTHKARERIVSSCPDGPAEPRPARFRSGRKSALPQERPFRRRRAVRPPRVRDGFPESGAPGPSPAGRRRPAAAPLPRPVPDP